MARHRRKSSRNWARGIFATFWILLGGLSGLYLFSAFNNPSALGGQLVKLNPAGNDTTASVSGGDQELAEIKASLRALSQQVAELSRKLNPEGADADKSAEAAPAPSAAPAAEPPAVKPPVNVAAATPPAQPAEAPKPAPPAPAQAEAPKPPVETPKPEAKPVEQAAVEPKQAPPEPASAPKPSEPPPVAVAPLDEPVEEDAPEADSEAAPSPPAESEPSSPPSAEAETPAPATSGAPSTPAAAPAPTESAALDPTALPPAANDGSTRYGIEIGIVAKQDALRPLWREYLTNHAALVAGLQPRRVLAPDKKWRLIAGPFGSAAEASQACALFKKASRPCEATVYAGDSL
jgi:hypothetical protein